MLNLFYMIFLYGSAIGFWLFIGIALRRILKRGSGLDAKIHTEENVNAVLSNTTTNEKVQIQ